MMNEESLIYKNLDARNEGVRHNLDKANNLLDYLQNILFGLVSFQFTFTSPLFTNKEILKDRQCWMVTLLLLSWIFGVISIISGLIRIYLNYRFHTFHANSEKKAAMIWADPALSYSEKKKSEKEVMDENLISSSSELTLILQTLFWLISFSFLLSISIGLLYMK